MVLVAEDGFIQLYIVVPVAAGPSHGETGGGGGAGAWCYGGPEVRVQPTPGQMGPSINNGGEGGGGSQQCGIKSHSCNG